MRVPLHVAAPRPGRLDRLAKGAKRATYNIGRRRRPGDDQRGRDRRPTRQEAWDRARSWKVSHSLIHTKRC